MCPPKTRNPANDPKMKKATKAPPPAPPGPARTATQIRIGRAEDTAAGPNVTEGLNTVQRGIEALRIDLNIPGAVDGTGIKIP